MSTTQLVRGDKLRPAKRSHSAHPRTKSEGKMSSIYGIMRFSVVTNVPEDHWRVARERSYNDYLIQLFSDKRLSRKLTLLDSVTLKSIDNNNIKELMILIIYSNLMPAWAIHRLEEISAKRSYVKLIPMGTKHKISRFSSDLIDSIHNKTQPYITFRIDDDDALDSTFIENLSRYCNNNYAGKIVTAHNGIYLAASGKENRLLFRRITYPNIGIGLALVTAAGGSSTIFSMGNHFHVAKRAEVIVDDRADAWIRSLYEDSDSQLGRKSLFRRHFKGQPFENLSIAECSDRLRAGFPGIDFSVWRTALLGNEVVSESLSEKVVMEVERPPSA